MTTLKRLFPFLAWLPPAPGVLRADVTAGVTVALVLVPQSMAYAQLAGLPAQYGLYTAFLPVLVAGLFGSSGQLSTGPVAVVSLLTAATLVPLAAQGSGQYVALAITLALLVGAIQLGLGAFRLGFVVNFLSQPVIAGFTSAAAIIIALSQVNKMLGVPMPRGEVFLLDVWTVLLQIAEVHWPSLAFGIGALAAMLAFRRWLPRWPGVLITVAAATALSAVTGFERTTTGRVENIADAEARQLAADYLEARRRVQALSAERAEKRAALARIGRRDDPALRQHAVALGYEIELLSLRIDERDAENRHRLRLLRRLAFEEAVGPGGETRFVPPGTRAAQDPVRWRIHTLDESGIRFSGGGEVVGRIPAGLPTPEVPRVDLAMIGSLLSAALVISLVGFMEAISIAKSIAARTRQRIDPNRELLGQGLANLAGSLTQCFPASGSFSRTAVNHQAGARTGLSSVVAAVLVMLTLLFLTPALYHLPQAVLAAVIMLAVISLIHFGAIRHAWRVQRHDGIAGALTFVLVLALAPHLDRGILAGAGLAVLFFLYRTMRPRVALLARQTDDAVVVPVRFDGQLYFANVPYFEETLLEVSALFPGARYILVVGSGINQIDSSGEQTIRELAQRFHENRVGLAFSGLKTQVRDALETAGALEVIGRDNLFATEEEALAVLTARASAAR